MTATTMDFTPRSFYILRGAPGWQDAPKNSPNAGATSASKIDIDALALESAKEIAQKRLASMPANEAVTPKLKELKETLGRVSLTTARTAGGLFQSLFDFLRRIFRAVVDTVCRIRGAQMHEGDPPANLDVAANSPAKEVAQEAAKSCVEIANSLASDQEFFLRLAEESAAGGMEMTVLREGLGRAEEGLVQLADELGQKTELFNELLQKEAKELKSDKGMMRMLLSTGQKVGSEALVRAYRDMAALKKVERTYSNALGAMTMGYGMDRVRDSKVLADFPYAAALIKKLGAGLTAQAEAPANPSTQAYVGPVSPDPMQKVMPDAAPAPSVARPVFGRRVSAATVDGPVGEIDLDDDEGANVVRLRPQP
jgi:hypothetical protein